MKKLFATATVLALLTIPVLADFGQSEGTSPQLLEGDQKELKGDARVLALSAMKLAVYELKTALVLEFVDTGEVPEDGDKAIKSVKKKYEKLTFSYELGDFKDKEWGIVLAKREDLSDVVVLEFLFDVPFDTLFVGKEADLEGGLIGKMVELRGGSDGSRDARRSEAESIVGSTKTQLRALYARTGEAPKADSKKVQQIMNMGVGEYTDRTTYHVSKNRGENTAKGIITCYMRDEDDGVVVSEFDFQTGTGDACWIDEGNAQARKDNAETIAGWIKTQCRALYSKTGTVPSANDKNVAKFLEDYDSEIGFETISYAPLPNGKGVITIDMKIPDDGILAYRFNFRTGASDTVWRGYSEEQITIDTSKMDGRRVMAATTTASVKKQLKAIYRESNTPPDADSEAVKAILETAAKDEVIASVEYEAVKHDTKKLGKITIVMANKADGKLVCTFNYQNNNVDVEWEDVEASAEEDPLAFYKKVGNFHLTKMTMKMKMGDDWQDLDATFSRTEVVKIIENSVTIKSTTYDADMKETSSHESTMDLTVAADDAADDAGVEKPEVTFEEIEVKAGKFMCSKLVYETDGSKTVTWTHGTVIVKIESTSDAIEMTMELQEYKMD